MQLTKQAMKDEKKSAPFGNTYQPTTQGTTRVDLAMLRPHPATLVPSCPIPKPNTPRSHGDSLTPPTRFQRTRENGAHLVRDSPPPMPLQRLIKFKPDHSTDPFMPQPNTRTENSMPGELYKALSPPECVVFPPNVFTGAHFRQA